MSAARPTRRRPDLSQHFLRRGALASSLVHDAHIRSAELVLEIGAGTGVITEALGATGARVLALELDPGIVEELRARFRHAPNVRVQYGDVLRVDLPAEPLRAFGSIPYAHTAAIVRRFLAHPTLIDAHFVMQLEAAQRYAGSPIADESLQSLMLKPWWHIEVVRHLRPTDFVPPPRVDSALLWLARRSPPLIPADEQREYERYLSRFFGRTRTTRAALDALVTTAQSRRLAVDLRLDMTAAPGRTRFEQWLGVYRFWRQSTGGDATPTAHRRRR